MSIQIPDFLLYKGEKYKLLLNPLNYYFNKNPDKKPQNVYCRSTALLRGYIATFEIILNELHLKDIEIENYEEINDVFYDSTISVKDEFLGEKNPKLEWCTGYLVFPLKKKSCSNPISPEGLETSFFKAKLCEICSAWNILQKIPVLDKFMRKVNYKYIDEESENYMLIGINKGNIISELEMNYTEFIKFREEKFKEYQETNGYLIDEPYWGYHYNHDYLLDLNEGDEKAKAERLTAARREIRMETIDFHLDCLHDQRPGYDAVYCVEYLGKIIKTDPKYKNKIINELINLQEITIFRQKQFAILDYHILCLIEKNYTELADKEGIARYIIKRQKSIFWKTKKKSKELIIKYGIFIY